jgi:hypothetical protein
MLNGTQNRERHGEAANAFMPTVQDLAGRAVRNPPFSRLIGV